MQTPNLITFNHWLVLKQNAQLTKGFNNFNADEIDSICIYYDADKNWLDYLERKKVEDIYPSYVLVPRFFWETHQETIPDEFIEGLEVKPKLEILKTNTQNHYDTLKNRNDDNIEIIPMEAKPRKEQIEVMATMHDVFNKNQEIHGIIQAAPGFGKAHSNNEIIHMSNGQTKTMGNLIPGDYVIDANGNPTKVTNIYPQGKLKKWLITFQDGTQSTCSGEHLWTVTNQRSKGQKRNIHITKTTKELAEDYIAGCYKTKYGTMQTEFRYGVELTQPVEYNNNMELSIHPYALGLLLADGSLSQNYNTFKYSDKYGTTIDILIYYLRKIDTDVSIWKYKGDYHIKSKSITDILRGYDILGKKSIDKFIPNDFMISTPLNRRALLQGFMDTDSYKYKNASYNHSTALYSSSKIMIHQLHKLTKSLGIYSNKIRVKKEPKYIYNDETRIGHPAYEFLLNTNPKKNRKTIIDIKELDETISMTCITVDNPRHLFLVGEDFTVTHNTFISIKYMSQIKARTLIIVPNEILNDQWTQSILDFTDLSVDNIGLIQGSDLSKNEDAKNKVVSIVKIQSLNSQIKTNSLEDLLTFYKDYNLVFYDEAHTSAAATSYAKTSSLLTTSNIIGLTATPYRDGLNRYLLEVSVGSMLYKSEHQNLVPDIEIHNIYTEFSPQEVQRLRTIGQDFVMFLGMFSSMMKNKDIYFKYLADVVAWNYNQGHNIVVLFPTIILMEKLQNEILLRHPDIIEQVLLLKGKTKQDAMELVKVERKILMEEYKEFKLEKDLEVKAKTLKRKDANIIIKERRAEIDSRIEYLKEHALDLYKQKVQESEIIISNWNLLSAGFDKSQMSNLIIGATPRIGKVPTIQAIGRVTRIHEGKKQPLVQYFIPSPFIDFKSSCSIILTNNIRIQYPEAKFKYQGFKT